MNSDKNAISSENDNNDPKNKADWGEFELVPLIQELMQVKDKPEDKDHLTRFLKTLKNKISGKSGEKKSKEKEDSKNKDLYQSNLLKEIDVANEDNFQDFIEMILNESDGKDKDADQSNKNSADDKQEKGVSEDDDFGDDDFGDDDSQENLNDAQLTEADTDEGDSLEEFLDDNVFNKSVSDETEQERRGTGESSKPDNDFSDYLDLEETGLKDGVDEIPSELFTLEEISGRRIADPLSEEKIFEEYLYPDEDGLSDEEDGDEEDWDSEFDDDDFAESAGESDRSWSEDNDDDLLDESSITMQKITRLRERIAAGELELRSVLARFLMLYVAENHITITKAKANELIQEAMTIYRTLLENGETEHLVSYARLLNERAFLAYFYASSRSKNVPLGAVQEAVRIINEYVSSEYTPDKEELREQLALAWRLLADSQEQNGAFNSALNSRLEEERIRTEFDSESVGRRSREMANVHLGIAANLCNLGDFESALKRYQQATDLMEDLVSNEKIDQALLINTTYRKSMVYHQLQRNDEGLTLLRELLERERQYIAPQREDLDIMAVYLNHLLIVGDFLMWTNSMQELTAFYNDLVKLCEDLYEKALKAEDPIACFFLVSLGDIWRQKSFHAQLANNSALADTALHKSLQIYVQACHLYQLDIRAYVVDIGARKASFMKGDEDSARVLRLIDPLIGLLEQIQNENSDRVISLYPRLLHHQGHLKCVQDDKEKVLPLLNKCLKYWEHMVDDNGRLMWRDSYAASFGERGTFYYRIMKDYPKALSDFSRSAMILYELVEEEKDYSQLGLYTAAVADRARTLIAMNRPEEGFAAVYDLFEFRLKLLGEKKNAEDLDTIYELVQVLITLIVQSKDTEHSSGRLEEILESFVRLRKIYEADNSFDRFNVTGQIDRIVFSLEFLQLIVFDFQKDSASFDRQTEKMLSEFRQYVLAGGTDIIDRGCALIHRFAAGSGKGENEKKAIDYLDSLIAELMVLFQSGALTVSSVYSNLFSLRANIYLEPNFLIEHQEMAGGAEEEKRLANVCAAFQEMAEFSKLVSRTDPYQGMVLLASSRIEYVVFLIGCDKGEEALEQLLPLEEPLKKMLAGPNDKNQTLLAMFLFYTGGLYRSSDPKKSLEYFYQALSVFDKVLESNTITSDALACLADTQRHCAHLLAKEEPEKALEHARKSRSYFELLKNENEENIASIAVSLFDLDCMTGEICYKGPDELKDQKNATAAFLSAEKDFLEMSELGRFTRYGNMIAVWSDLLALLWKNWSYQQIDDLNQRLELWESNLSEVIPPGDLARYCLLRYQMAYYSLIRSKAAESLKTIENAEKIFNERILSESGDSDFNINFPLMAASIRGWALRELGHFQEALDLLAPLQKKIKKSVDKKIAAEDKKDSIVREEDFEFFFNYRNIGIVCAVNLLRLRKFKRSERCLVEMEKLSDLLAAKLPGDIVNVAFLRIIRAELRFAQKNYTEALESAEKAIEILKSKKSDLPGNFGEALRWKAASLWKLGRGSDAHTVCDAGIILLVEETESVRRRGRFELIDLFVLKAKILIDQKNSASAKGFLSAAEKILKTAQQENLSCNQNFEEEISNLLKKCK